MTYLSEAARHLISRLSGSILLAIGDTVTISVNSRNILKFYCGKITAINGDKISVLNTVMEKSWEVTPQEIK